MQAGENLYGVHPMYVVVEEDGSSHAVLWLNSNAMGEDMLCGRLCCGGDYAVGEICFG